MTSEIELSKATERSEVCKADGPRVEEIFDDTDSKKDENTVLSASPGTVEDSVEHTGEEEKSKTDSGSPLEVEESTITKDDGFTGMWLYKNTPQHTNTCIT